MRFNRNTGILLVILLAVIGASLLLLSNPATSGNATATPQSQTIPVFEGVTVQSIRSLTVRDNVANIETVIQQAEDGTWVLQDNPSALGQTDVDNALAGWIGLQSTDRFDTDTLEPYGLVNPAYTVTINDGTTDYVLSIGIKNPAGTRYYALLADDTDTVFVVNNPSAIDRVVGYVVTPPLAQVPTPTSAPTFNTAGLLYPTYNPTDVDVFTVRDNAGNQTIFKRNPDGTWAIDPFSTQYQAGASVDQVLADAVVASLTNLTALDVIQGADGVALGLAEPAYEIIAEARTGITYTLKVGITDPTNTRYYVLPYELLNVGVVEKADIDAILSIIANPPYAVEATSEATAEATSEATAEATSEATAEATSEATTQP